MRCRDANSATVKRTRWSVGSVSSEFVRRVGGEERGVPASSMTQVDDQGREQVTMSTSVKSLVAKSSPPESVGGATGLDADGISMAATGVQEIFVGNAGRMRSMDARKQAKCLIWQFPMR